MNFENVVYEEIKNVERFKNISLDKEKYTSAMNYIVTKIDEWLQQHDSDEFPSEYTENLTYNPVKNVWGWTTGFWTGMIWLAYEYTGDDKYKLVGGDHVKTFRQRLDNMDHLDHHDIGFLYSLSCVAGYRLTKNEEAKKTALDAANLLANRYVEAAKHIDRGHVAGRPENESKSIIDCSLNIPLMYWAYEETGEYSYYEKAYNHMIETNKYAVREDASCFQGVVKDRYTGELISQDGSQGYSDESGWARGQAWGIYGNAISYSYTKDERLLQLSKKLINYYLNRLPDDDICGWDLVFTGNDDQRDTSAATPAICGMLEVAKHLPVSDPDREIYEKAALKMLMTLYEEYTTEGTSSNGILKHGVYVFNSNGRKGANVDDLCIWGDYYYMEALYRILKIWNMYW